MLDGQLAVGLRLCAVFLLCFSSRVWSEQLTRHTSWPAAQEAARKSGKLILVYIYKRGNEACAALEDNTLSNEAVIRALQAYEFAALNGDSSQNRDFCNRYRVGLRYNEQQEKDTERMAFAAVPAYLFLDAEGREYFRLYGYFAPDVFLHVLGQIARAVALQQALAGRPQDARLHADLGHLYLEMNRPLQGRPLLEAAIRLDPRNETGARADAELDLIILSIPDDPEQAFRQLVAYQFNYPDSKRALEIRYYMAVAQLAAGREDLAEKILLDFAAIPPFLPDDHGLPNVAYGYLVEKEGRPIGFWPLDDEAQVRAKVKEAGEDPTSCRFIRKAINPDYRNPWTEKADLLLKQLRKLQEERGRAATR